MRICVNIIEDSDPRLIEEDVEIALGKVGRLQFAEWDITEHEGGTITADTEFPLGKIPGLAPGLASLIEIETGARVEVEIIEGWPPSPS